MYGDTSTNPTLYVNNELPYTFSPDFLAHFSAPIQPPPVEIPGADYEAVSAAFKVDFGYATSSTGCSSYGSPTSLTGSYGTHVASSELMMMQRSLSSHSLHRNLNAGFHQLVTSPTEYLDSDTSPVRKVYSTGDLQGINKVMQGNQIRSESPLSNESSCSTIIEGMITKACPYTPEQKKEKIDKYRSKRTQRNFNKKIKYECRKTLADSRPRIRGRFAKNEETEKAPPNQLNTTTSTVHQYWINHDQLSGDIEEHDHQQLDDDNNWVDFLNAFSSNLIP